MYLFGDAGTAVPYSFTNNTVVNCDGYGIHLNFQTAGTTGSGTVTGNNVSNCGANGMFFYTYNQAVVTNTIQNNTVLSCVDYGIYARSYQNYDAAVSTFTIDSNVVTAL